MTKNKDDIRSIFEYVKDRVNIVDVVSLDEQLQKESGSRYQGKHKDHGKKGGRCLAVYENTQSFYCFDCGAGGDVIDYVADRDNCSKMEALNWLCETCHIPLPDWTEEQKVEYEKKRKEKAEVRDLLKEAFKFYHDAMTPEQRAYYHSRGLTDETIDKQLCGYAGTGNALFRHMIDGQENVEQLLKTGLFFKFDSGIKDRYEDRYVIPYWYRGEIVFSIGRSLDPNIEAHKKYVKHLTHSDKYPYVSAVAVQHIIYNEDQIRGAKEILITEGIFDVMLAIQAGYTAISPITTKFSNKDNERLADLCKNAETVCLLNDSEVSGAGEAGAVKTAKVLAGAGIKVKLATIPRPDDVEKVDLADYILEAGDKAKEAVDELLENADTLLNYQLRRIPQDIDRMELAVEVEELLKEQLELGRDKDILSMFLDHKLKATFDLKDKDIRNYQSMLVRLSKKHEAQTKEQERKERQREHKQKMENLKKTDFAKYLRELIEETRTQPYKKAFQIKQSVANIVIEDMTSHGKFYRTSTDLYYYFNDDTLKLVEIGDQTFTHYVKMRYGLNKSEKEYEYLFYDLEAHAGTYGELTEVYRFAHYDLKTKTLYVDRNDCHMYRLNGETIDLLNNGADNVLFISGSNEPFKLVDIGDQRFIYPIIIEPTNFIRGADVNLDKAEQQIMLRVWIDCLFFEELQPTKVIVLFLGERRSGKTTQQRKIGKWLKGKDFNVQGIGDKEDSFDATITGNYLASFDNVDTYKTWLNDRLAQCATGQIIEKRKLYTTNEIARYYPRCFITLNSREPKFKRDDVVDRLLLFRVQRLEHVLPEAKILKEVSDNRNKLWTELLHELNGIVKALRENYDPPTLSYRMADFADLGWRIAKSDDAGDLWLSLLDKMSKDKSEFLLLDDPIFQVIEGLLAGGTELKNMTSGQLYKVFKEYAEKEEIDFAYIKTANSLSQRIGHMITELRSYFIVKRDRPNSRSPYHYTFEIKDLG